MKNKKATPQWQPMETAPDDRPILLDVGLPWAVVGGWFQESGTYIYTHFNVWGDKWYFENEYKEHPIGWMPLPEIQRKMNWKTKAALDELASGGGKILRLG